MTNYPKTAHWITLSSDFESVDKTTNPQFKKHVSHLLQKMKQRFFCSKLFFDMIQYPCVHTNLQKYQEVCE